MTTIQAELADLLVTTGLELDDIAETAATRAAAVVLLARLRRPIAAISVASSILNIEAAQEHDAYEAAEHAAHTACEVLRDAVAPQLAHRHTVAGITQLLDRAAALADAEPAITPAAVEQFSNQIAAHIAKVLGLLSTIAQDQTVLPDLRDAAHDAFELLQHAALHYAED